MEKMYLTPAQTVRTIVDFRDNLLPVMLGNILGGVLFVAFAYWYVHLKVDAPPPR